MKLINKRPGIIDENKQRKDLLSTLINQFWRLISGPITLLLIPLFLSPEQQGYWYLFGSLSALSIFADLGFSNIILQFAAHEYAFLHFTEEGSLEGEKLYLQRLGSFFRFTLRWISTICAVVFPVIFIIGIVFFIRDHVLDIYFSPWILYAVGSLINFFCNSILSFIEGLNKIDSIQKIRFRVAVLNTCIVTLVLVLGGNIYALALAMLLSASSVFISIFGVFRKILSQLMIISKGFHYNWKKEIVPLFIKYALSFSSGYFIFQIYTPLMHYFHGPVYSGKVGISLSLAMAVFNMGNIWIYTIIPRINMFISQKQWEELDILFIKRLLLSIGTYLFIILGVVIFLVFFRNIWIIPKIISRFLPTVSLIILFICYFFQLLINSWAVYLRGHKQEPYVIPSIVSAVWILIITFAAGKFMSPEWFFTGFLSSYVWGLPVCYIIYRKCKGKWHGR